MHLVDHQVHVKSDHPRIDSVDPHQVASAGPIPDQGHSRRVETVHCVVDGKEAELEK